MSTFDFFMVKSGALRYNEGKDGGAGHATLIGAVWGKPKSNEKA